MEKARNRIGALSLAAALVGFLLVTFQPWLPLDRILLFKGLTLKGLLSAFFDASLVGALADWFAVTALFRGPLGIRLPHTDILARNKDAIAEAVPRFLTSFVSEEKVAATLGAVDFAEKTERLLGEGSGRDEIHDFVRRRLTSLIDAVAPPEGAAADGLRVFVGETASFVMERLDPGPALGSLLRRAQGDGIVDRVVEAGAEILRVQIGRNAGRITAYLLPLLRRNAGWQGVFVGQATVMRLLRGVQTELAQMRTNPRNDIRRFLLDALDSYAARLSGRAEDPDGERERFRDAVRGVLSDASFQSTAAALLGDMLRRLGSDLRQPRSGLIDGMTRLEQSLATQLRSNPDLRQRFNRGVAGLISGVIARSRLIEGMTGYITTLLKNTDEREFVKRIEDAVWSDLQYIRFNGAAVGALVGLLLAMFSALVQG